MDEALKPYTPVLLYTHMFTGSTKSQEISSTPEKRRLFIGRIMSKMTISEEDDQSSSYISRKPHHSSQELKKSPS